MASISIRPRFYELGPFREQYAAFVGDLEAEGYFVMVETENEYRGGTALEVLNWDVAVYLADIVEEAGLDVVVGVVVGAALARLRGKRVLGGGKRQLTIYGPNGEKLRDVELPDEGD